MSFHEVRFPEKLSYGSAGGPSFRTDIVETDSGAESRVARWNEPRHRYDVAYSVKSLTDLSEIRQFFIHRQGHLNGFRFKDHMDCTSSPTGLDPALGGAAVTATDQSIGTGTGALTTFQLQKTYSDGLVSRTRTVLKPVAGTVVVAVNGTPQASGWSVNTTTGIVTFTSAPANGAAITAGFQFDVPVRFDVGAEEALITSIDQWDDGTARSILLVELLNESTVSEEFFFGGSKEIVSADNLSVASAEARVFIIKMTAGSKSVTLPNPSAYSSGGPHFYICGHPATTAFALKDHLGNTLIASIAANKAATVWLTVDGSGTKLWVAS